MLKNINGVGAYMAMGLSLPPTVHGGMINHNVCGGVFFCRVNLTMTISITNMSVDPPHVPVH